MQLLQFFAALDYQIPFLINWLKLVQQLYYSVDEINSGLVLTNFKFTGIETAVFNEQLHPSIMYTILGHGKVL